ncbi:hypothetical protein [Nocardia sp. NPDC003979]
MRYISISLHQWAARTPDDYNEAVRASIGMRALTFSMPTATGFVPVRAFMAADLAERASSPRRDRRDRPPARFHSGTDYLPGEAEILCAAVAATGRRAVGTLQPY